MIDEAADDNKKVIETNNEQRDKTGDKIVDEPDNEPADDKMNVEQHDKPGDEIVDEPGNEAADDKTNVIQPVVDEADEETNIKHVDNEAADGETNVEQCDKSGDEIEMSQTMKQQMMNQMTKPVTR